MTPEELRARTKAYAAEVICATKPLVAELSTRHLASQASRAAASVAANYRATCLARSRADFLSKLSVVLEEADEALYWLELLQDTSSTATLVTPALVNESRQLVRIFASSLHTARRRQMKQ